MLFHKVFLAAAAVATTYAGPCKPVSSSASVSSSADASIPSSTVSVEVSDATRTATSESSGTEEATSSVTIGSETVTSGGSTTLATLLSNSGSVSEGLSTSETGSRSSDPTTDTIEPTSGATTDPSTTQHSTTEGTTTEATTAAPTSTSEFCYDNAYVISMLAFDPVASPFCVSYLSMTTHTITDYATTDPTNVYQVDVATITADALTQATVTSTRSIETITCLDTAYSYTAPVPTFDRGGPSREKRGQDEIEIPEAIPSDWTEAQTSDICSCLDLEEPTTHTTITETTSTVTAWVVETTFADNNDIAYRRFTCPFNANVYDDGFTTNYFKGKTPLSSGNTQTLQFSTCSTLSLSGSGTFDPSQVALLYNAYFYAKETGMYTFSVPDTIDNWGYLWVKDAAYTWNVNAWAIQGTRTGQNSQLWKGGSYQIQLKKGDAIPFTYLWANGGGCAGNDLSVRTPSGKSIPGMAGSTVKACHLNKFN
ncbi:hypothetical protein FOC4_g10004780 [Fusarium odoratissimum]|uniref:PA14 domain-containing protein n=1 Tax=Fusarium oxysporum f. sp. cubense (strain race 4) TaxID=2502994 RepID=N1S3I1_FUSC4|nr:hypothetical protein FOC4_g10004780 [Fusarium odoratissimum]